MNPRGRTKRPFNIGYSAASPVVVVVVVSGYSCAWRDGSDGCYTETPVVVVVSRHTHAWHAGSNTWFFKIPVIVVDWCDSSDGFVCASGGCDGIMLSLAMILLLF